MTMSFPTTTTCNGGSAGEIYTYFGDLRGGDIMTISHPGILDNVYYYQVRLIYGLIAIDQWDQNTIITTTFLTNTTSTVYTNQLGQNTQSKVCGTQSRFESYRVVRRDWPYSLVSNLDFQITTDNTNTT